MSWVLDVLLIGAAVVFSIIIVGGGVKLLNYLMGTKS